MCTATVSGDPPSGIVKWSAYSSEGNVVFSPSTCTLTNSSCAVKMTATPKGDLAVRADYVGDSGNAGSSGTFVPSVVTTQARGKPGFVVVNPDTGLVYVGNIGSNSVSVINASTNSVVAGITVGAYPASMAVDPTTDRIYVANEQSSTLSVIDGASNTVIDTVNVGSGPTGVAVNPNTDLVYVAYQSFGVVSVVNGSTDKVVGNLTLAPNYQTIAVDQSLDRVYVATAQVCHSTGNGGQECGPNGAVAVLDGTATRILTNVTVGGSPEGIAVNSITHMVYVANDLSGTVSVINGTNDSVVATVDVGQYPRGVTVDASTGNVYVANEGSGTVSVINGSNNQLAFTIMNVGDPAAIAVNPASGTIYAANTNFGTVSVIDKANDKVVQTISGWGDPMSVSVNPVINTVYVGYDGSDFISVLNGSTNELTNSILFGYQNSTFAAQTTSIAVNTLTDMIYAISLGSGAVSVIDGHTFAVVANISVQGLALQLAVDSNTNMVYVTSTVSSTAVNGMEEFSSIVSVIDGLDNKVVDTIPIPGSAEGVAVNPSTNTVYAATTGQYVTSLHEAINNGTISIINGSTDVIIKSLSVSAGAWGVAVDPTTNMVYVSSGGGSVHVVDGSTNTVVGDVPIGDQALGIAVDPTTNLVYVGTCNTGLHVINGSSPYTRTFPYSNQSATSNVTINSNTTSITPSNSTSGNGEILPPIPIGTCSYSIAVNPISHAVYVAGWDSGTLSVVEILTSS